MSEARGQMSKPRDPRTFVFGWRLLQRGPRFLGSGKVAGKVLIVDQYAEHANMLILLETVLKWC